MLRSGGSVLPSVEQLLADELGSESDNGGSYCSQLSHTPYYGHHLECDLGDVGNIVPPVVVAVLRCTIILSFRAKLTPVKKVEGGLW